MKNKKLLIGVATGVVATTAAVLGIKKLADKNKEAFYKEEDFFGDTKCDCGCSEGEICTCDIEDLFKDDCSEEDSCTCGTGMVYEGMNLSFNKEETGCSGASGGGCSEGCCCSGSTFIDPTGNIADLTDLDGLITEEILEEILKEIDAEYAREIGEEDDDDEEDEDDE